MNVNKTWQRENNALSSAFSEKIETVHGCFDGVCLGFRQGD